MSAIFCGANGKLSFEHVPPEAAFNDQRVLESDRGHRVAAAASIAGLALPRLASEARKNFIVLRGVNNSTAVRTTPTGRAPNRCRLPGGMARGRSAPRVR